ncbi:hypothetical protein ACP4OV_007676 [Aristida adscensionis]
MGVTLVQVDRHYRDYKEKWKIVEKALNNSGNGFDVTRCKITISESEKSKLNDRQRRLLSKPIKFFHEMQEVFMGNNVDVSLAMDQESRTHAWKVPRTLTVVIMEGLMTHLAMQILLTLMRTLIHYSHLKITKSA